MVWSIGIFLAVLSALGAITAKEALAMRRWDPRLFRGGVRVYCKRVSLNRDILGLAIPSTRPGLLRPGVRARRLTPLEIAFVAPVLSACVMRGLLRYNRSTRSLESVGYLHWRSWILFAWGFLLLFGAKGIVPIVALGVCGYLVERRRFTEVLEEARKLGA